MKEPPCTLTSPVGRRYYPDFYAPLATDLKGLPDYEIKLDYGKPFPPLAQLLSVLPPQSAQVLHTKGSTSIYGSHTHILPHPQRPTTAPWGLGDLKM